MVEGFVRMMAIEHGFTGPLNLGNPGEFTMLELAEKFLSLVDTKSKFILMAFLVNDPKQRQTDISLIKAKLDWVQKVNLEDGLKDTLCFFRRLLFT